MRIILVKFISNIFFIFSFYLADTLQRHLNRSLCTDICDVIIREIDTSANAKAGQLSIEVRLRIRINLKDSNFIFRIEIKSFRKCLNQIEVN
jgi:hypothetical protein